MSGPSLVVGLAARMLPSWARDRYASEFHAELTELTSWRRWTHALTVLATAYPLRIAVLRAAAVGQGFAPTFGCLTGVRHRWARAWTEDGQRYQRCRRCGLDRAPTQAGAADHLSPNAWPR